MDTSMITRLKELEAENARLKIWRPNKLRQQFKISYFERVKLNPTIRSKKYE